MRKWLRQLLCRHRMITNTVSGYGYTEYRIWFCCRCEKPLWKQTKEQH